MKLDIRAQLDYQFADPTDVLVQLEAAALPDQTIEHAHIALSACDSFARVAGHDQIGDRIWLTVDGRLTIDYRATIAIHRRPADWQSLPRVPMHRLPGETTQYLMASRYCQSDQFHIFADAEFAGLDGGPRIAAIRDWIAAQFRYVSGVSTSDTTAIDSFVRREGICRDYAHMLITLARASAVPARMASVYAPGVTPQDFHAVAEVFLGGEWHLVDATGMADAADMAKIGVGRDAADIAFLTTYGDAVMNGQTITVTPAG